MRSVITNIGLFESPMDLHYSQTHLSFHRMKLSFESPMDLHYSQTQSHWEEAAESLNPLWIYTTLKRR